MNFDLSDEQQLVERSTREWAGREVAPHIRQLDREHRFDRALFPKMAGLGLLGVCIGWVASPTVEGQTADSVSGQATGTFAATPLGSLDLGFLKVDVLAHARIVFLEAQLLGLRARVLLGHVEESRVRGADELDLDGCRLGHRTVPNAEKRKAAYAAQVVAQMTHGADSVNRRMAATAS